MDTVPESSEAWQEAVPEGEDAAFHAYAASLLRYQSRFAVKGDGQPHRGFHVKSHAGLAGTFTVAGAIPDKARHGIFAAPASYPALVRISNGFSAPRPDWLPDLLGLSVKLCGIAGPKLLDGENDSGTQDFLALNQPYLPARDANELLVMSTASANLLTAPVVLLRQLGLAQALRALSWSLGWAPRRLFLRSPATETFHSGAPIAIGPHAVKFAWRPHPAPPSPRDFWHRNRLRDALRRHLAEAALRFDFTVQFFTDPARTPIDGAYAWKEADAPSVKLAELTIPPTDIDTPEAHRQERRINALSFNPWHAIAAHRPIGNIQRARRIIYQASARNWGRDADPA
jgi:hypothetical protein